MKRESVVNDGGECLEERFGGECLKERFGGELWWGGGCR